MSAHQIPNRIGGDGGNSENVRPWNKSFKDGKWQTSVEDKFDDALVAAEEGDKVSYEVTTTDMDDDKAQEIIDKSTITTEKSKTHHKTKIKKIPLEVTAPVGGITLSKTDDCYKGLIQEDQRHSIPPGFWQWATITLGTALAASYAWPLLAPYVTQYMDSLNEKSSVRGPTGHRHLF